MLDSKTSANGAGVLVITQDASMGKHQGEHLKIKSRKPSLDLLADQL